MNNATALCGSFDNTESGKTRDKYYGFFPQFVYKIERKVCTTLRSIKGIGIVRTIQCIDVANKTTRLILKLIYMGHQNEYDS